jgi:hypothetical protein
MINFIRTNKIQVICPICNTRDLVGIPPSRLNKKSKLTIISVHKGLICPHHFQFFIDNNFQIRGYQKVDLELNQENSKKFGNGIKVFNIPEKGRDRLFQKLIIDGNQVKFQSLNSNKSIKTRSSLKDIISIGKNMTLKEIYEEFWEFIDESNKIFRELLIKDNRRQKSSIDSNMNEYLTV